MVFMTGRDTIKDKNILRDTRIMLSIDDERPPFSLGMIEGTAVASELPLAELLSWCNNSRGVREEQSGVTTSQTIVSHYGNDHSGTTNSFAGRRCHAHRNLVVQKRSSRRKRTTSQKSEERYSLTCEKIVTIHPIPTQTDPHGHVQDTSNGNGHNGKAHL